MTDAATIERAPMPGASPRPPSPSASYPQPSAVLRLGMPHLGASGLCEGFALSTAADLHWASIARRAGVAISRLVDVTGARALPSIVAARVTGALGGFREDAFVRLDQVEAPAPENGWRSVLRIRTVDGSACADVELVSRFARREGPSNAALGPAEMPSALRAAAPETWPLAARVTRARGRTLRHLAPGPGEPPLLSLPVVAEGDLNGVGLLYFARFLRFFAAAEAEALVGPWPLPPVRRREMFWYGNADAGDRLDIHCDVLVTELAPDPAVMTAVTARRASDGALVAAGEILRAAP